MGNQVDRDPKILIAITKCMLNLKKYKYFCLLVAEAYKPKEDTLPMGNQTDDTASDINGQKTPARPMSKKKSYRLCAAGMEMSIRIKHMNMNKETKVTKEGNGISAARRLVQNMNLWLANKLATCLGKTRLMR